MKGTNNPATAPSPSPSKPRIQVTVTPEVQPEVKSMGPPPPQVRSALKKTDGIGKQKQALLGSDLVPPPMSEFKLKSKLDPADRGRPMVDWIRKQSAQDSGNYAKTNAGTTSGVREISEQELSTHNTSRDAWMALRGQVFDVTDYVSFHPGGVREIMKGVGKDGTTLFNSIHRYVNFESILKGKQVGIYAPNRRSSLSGNEGGDLVVTNLRTSRSGSAHEYEEALIPATKFREDKSHCFFTVNLRNLKYNEKYWTASILQKERLLLKVVTIPPEMWVGYYKLREALLNDAISINFANRYRTMTVKIEKPKELPWKSIGDALPDSDLILDSRHSIDDRNPCTLILREELAQDMYLLGLEVSPSARIGVPVGFDVKVTAVKEATSRRYTPIPLIFHTEQYKRSQNEVIYLVVKIYKDGKMTQILKNVPTQEPGLLEVGYSCGNFNTDWLHGGDTYFLFGAGSGITPFISILKYYLDHNSALGVSHVVLVHWVKQEADLIWEEEFAELEKKKKWFKFLPSLTQVAADDESWQGLRGRISDDLLAEILKKLPSSATKNKNRVRFMTCGPEGFNCGVCETIDRAGYPLNSTFIFLG